MMTGQMEDNMDKKLTPKEKDLLDRLTLHAIRNGNTVNPTPFEYAPQEYVLLHSIRIKLELN